MVYFCFLTRLYSTIPHIAERRTKSSFQVHTQVDLRLDMLSVIWRRASCLKVQHVFFVVKHWIPSKLPDYFITFFVYFNSSENVVEIRHHRLKKMWSLNVKYIRRKLNTIDPIPSAYRDYRSVWDLGIIMSLSFEKKQQRDELLIKKHRQYKMSIQISRCCVLLYVNIIRTVIINETHVRSI